MGRLKTSDKVAMFNLEAYYDRYVGIRGELPRMAVGMMEELPGWPVRNPDGGANIAHFTSSDLAQRAVSQMDRAFRAKGGK